MFPSAQAKTPTWTSPLGRPNPASTVETVVEPPNLSKSPSPPEGERPGPNSESHPGGALFDVNFENLLVDLEEVTRSNSHIRATDLLSVLDPQITEQYDPDGGLPHGAVTPQVHLLGVRRRMTDGGERQPEIFHGR